MGERSKTRLPLRQMGAQPVPGIRQPVQTSLIVGIGTKIFGNMDLEAPATAAVRENRWEFVLTGAPIPPVGGRGSPLNPVALS